MIDILKLTAEDFKKGKYKNIFPEVYKTRGLIEKNPWHDNQDVFDHVLKVFQALKIFLNSPPISTSKSIHLQKRLNQKNDKLSRKEILILISINHDIGKYYSLIKKKDRKTEAPGHEEISAYLVKTNNKLNLKEKDLKVVFRNIAYHGFINNIANIYEQLGDTKILKLFKKIVKDWEVELILFMLADIEGSDLRRLNREEYNKHRKTLIKMLEFYL